MSNDNDPSAVNPTLFAIDLLNAMGSRKAVQLLNPKAEIEWWESAKSKQGVTPTGCGIDVFALEDDKGIIISVEKRWIEALNEQTLYNRAWTFIRGQIMSYGMMYFDELLKAEKTVEGVLAAVKSDALTRQIRFRPESQCPIGGPPSHPIPDDWLAQLTDHLGLKYGYSRAFAQGVAFAEWYYGVSDTPPEVLKK